MERFRKLGRCKDAHRHGVWTVSPLNLSEDGRSQHFVTGGADGVLKTWSFEQTAVKSEVPNAANGDADAHMQIVDAPCKAVLSLEAHALAVVGVAVARNAPVAASTSLDGSLKLWDLSKDSDQDPRSINMDVTESWALALSSNGETLVSCGNAGNVQVFDTKVAISEQSMVIERKSRDSEHRGAERPMAMCAAISQDDKRVAIGAQDGSVTVFDLETGKVVSTALRLHAGPIRSIKYSPTEPSTIITASDDQLVNFYDLDSAKVTGACRGHTGHILCVDVSPDGKHIASAGTDRTVRIWDRGSKECLFKYRDHEETIWDVAYAYGGQRLISVSDDACIGVVDCSLANSVM